MRYLGGLLLTLPSRLIFPLEEEFKKAIEGNARRLGTICVLTETVCSDSFIFLTLTLHEEFKVQ